MLKSESKTIDGIDVTTTQFAAMRGYALMVEIGKAGGDAENVMLDPSLMLKVLASTSAWVTNDRGRQCLPLVDEENINLVFNGKLPALLETVQFALEVNYRDFKKGSVSANAGAGAPKAPGQPVA